MMKEGIKNLSLETSKNNHQHIEDCSNDKKLLLYDKPQVCLFDVTDDVLESLLKSGFNCVRATLGSKISIDNVAKNKTNYIKPNYQIPANLHEFDLIILDMTHNQRISCFPEDYIMVTAKPETGDSFACPYPEREFNPRPLAVNQITSVPMLFALTSLDDYLTKDSSSSE